MKKRLHLRVLSLLLIVCITAGLTLSVSADYPSPTNNVYDGLNTLSDSVLETIKSTNEILYDRFQIKISICIVESIGDAADMATYARGVFNDWRLGEGVLLVLSTGDDDYYALQSTKVAPILTNSLMDSIFQEFMDKEFRDGNISLGVQRTVNKLAGFFKNDYAAAIAESTDPETEGEQKTEGEKEEVTFGSVVLSILKILGWTLLILVVLFIIVFVAAMFNDDVAEILQKLVFSRIFGTRPANQQNYYDERLYGGPQNGGQYNQGRVNGQNNGQGQRRLPPAEQQYDNPYGVQRPNKYEQYRNGGQYGNGQYQNGQYGNGQYQNGQYQNGQYGNRQYQNGQYGNGQYNNGQYPQQRRPQQGQGQNQNRNGGNYEYTQQYNIPVRDNRNTNRRQNGDRY